MQVTGSRAAKSWSMFGNIIRTPGSNLVDVYINRVQNKINQNGFTKLIHTVRGVGYRLGLPEKKEEEVDNSNHEDSFSKT